MSKSSKLNHSDDDEKVLEQFDKLTSSGAIYINDSDDDVFVLDDDASMLNAIDEALKEADIANQSQKQPSSQHQPSPQPQKSTPQQQQQPQPPQEQPSGFRLRNITLNEVLDQASSADEHSIGDLPFPEGAVRLTRMLGEKEDRNSFFTFRDLIQPDKLRKALLTTYVLDMEWMMPHFNPQTKLVIVKSYNPKSEARGAFQSDNGRVTIVHPEFGKQRYPIMHSKIMLLFYDNYVRFVASSANLIEIDWTILQNIVFIQDVRLDPSRNFAPTEFGTTLTQALHDLSVPEQVVAQISHMDLSRVAVHIVTSVPTVEGRSKFHADAYGLVRLSQIGRRLRQQRTGIHGTGVLNPMNTELYCYGSSMGRLTNKFLCDFFCSAVGVTWSELQQRSGNRATIRNIAQRVKVGFHTNTQGNTNKFGPSSRVCIKFNPDFFYADTYPVSTLHKIEPAVSDTLVHAKIVLMRTGSDCSNGWMYLGSHNFTTGAWGHMRNAGRNRFFVNNYEFGVIIPNVHFETMFGRDSVTWNGSRIPLPFKLAWSRYNDSDIPCLG
ncbi:hypothetical protein H4R20_000039 [Coemansia guatemalensis]|uniref:Phospholipase D/nuclease n=1 Tax=Coemansia guatemalensis TaxID=2761395 RepID=A0A9W8I709_9FUNG|nr:hypothetical protein H4R20_000039 [Coemansia guatemalensis]